jgi:hypothetical protein
MEVALFPDVAFVVYVPHKVCESFPPTPLPACYPHYLPSDSILTAGLIWREGVPLIKVFTQNRQYTNFRDFLAS